MITSRLGNGGPSGMLGNILLTRLYQALAVAI
jgi:hypothetical protein